jgi:hypothetical protein
MRRGKVRLILLLVVMCQVNTVKTFAQANELAQLALNIEKLGQFKQILSDLKKGYQIVSQGYSTVKNISQGNFSIHKIFLDGLLQVSPAVRKYKKIPAIIQYQINLVREYKNAYKRFRSQGTFTEKELAHLGHVYGNLVEQSLQNLDELITVTTAGKLRMSDDERLKAIDRIHLDMQEKVVFLRKFNEDTGLLSLSRAKENKELRDMEVIHGIRRDFNK